MFIAGRSAGHRARRPLCVPVPGLSIWVEIFVVGNQIVSYFVIDYNILRVS